MVSSSSSNRCRKVPTSKASAKGSCAAKTASSASKPSPAKEQPLRTSLVRDSVKKRIFAYMDKGDRSADIETKSGLSHLLVKHHRHMWKDERYDARLRSRKKRSKRKARGRVPASCEAVKLPLRLKEGWGLKNELCRVQKSGADKGRRRHRARGVKEREVGTRRDGAGSRVRESGGLLMGAAGSPVAAETQLVIRLRERPVS
ncbi:hypothetical protein IMSHALPRED_003248 [Imshaugia aleurites]|uniref:Uncharacterized protein n=1 Tax=Imshaugia aleurites TaxID=172621 RepID=A0A8H3F1I1_9LECA|nr:hypothetical protein IMSHALPRED_003248 [Imshaugia aleurites]